MAIIDFGLPIVVVVLVLCFHVTFYDTYVIRPSYTRVSQIRLLIVIIFMVHEAPLDRFISVTV